MEAFVRAARPDDAAALRDHILSILEESDLQILLQPGEYQRTVAQEAEKIRRLVDAPNSAMFLAFVGSQLVGEISLQGGDRQALAHEALLGMSVHRKWRGKGIGSVLMAEAMAWADENPMISRVELAVYSTNARAIQLYKKFGFEIEGHRQRKIYQHGEFHDDYIMARLF